MVLRVPISVLTSIPTLVMTLLLIPLIIQITTTKNVLNCDTSSIGTLVSTVIHAYSIILYLFLVWRLFLKLIIELVLASSL